MHVELVELAPQNLLTIRAHVPVGELGDFLPAAYAELTALLEVAATPATGPVRAWFHARPGAETDVSAAVPVPEDLVLRTGRVTTTTIPGGPALVTTHRGAYACLPHVWMRLEDERAARGLVVRGDLVEEYTTEPAPGGDPAAAETRLVLPLRQA